MKTKAVCIGLEVFCYGIQVATCITVLKYAKRIYHANCMTATVASEIHDKLFPDEKKDTKEEND